MRFLVFPLTASIDSLLVDGGGRVVPILTCLFFSLLYYA